MSRRLVIPIGDTADSESPIVRDGVALTWAQVAALNGADQVEPLGSQWCTDNAVDGLGIATELPPPPPFVPPVPSNIELAGEALATLAADALASPLADVRAIAAGLDEVATILKGGA